MSKELKETVKDITDMTVDELDVAFCYPTYNPYLEEIIRRAKEWEDFKAIKRKYWTDNLNKIGQHDKENKS